MYHVISDKIAVTMNSTIQIGRHQIERTSQSAACAIMQFCAFNMQIGNYRAYATIPRNEFSTNDQDLRKNPKEATIFL